MNQRASKDREALPRPCDDEEYKADEMLDLVTDKLRNAPDEHFEKYGRDDE